MEVSAANQRCMQKGRSVNLSLFCCVCGGFREKSLTTMEMYVKMKGVYLGDKLQFIGDFAAKPCESFRPPFSKGGAVKGAKPLSLVATSEIIPGVFFC